MQRRFSLLAIAMLGLCCCCELLLRETRPHAPQQPPTPGGETSPPAPKPTQPGRVDADYPGRIDDHGVRNRY